MFQEHVYDKLFAKPMNAVFPVTSPHSRPLVVSSSFIGSTRPKTFKHIAKDAQLANNRSIVALNLSEYLNLKMFGNVGGVRSQRTLLLICQP